MEDFYLREICVSDAKVTHTWRNDADVIEGLGSPYRFVNLQAEETWFADYQNNRATQLRLAIVNNKNEKLIGMGSLVKIDSISRSAEFSLQIGDKDFWGMGIGKWVTKSIMSHAFNHLNLNRIYLYVLDENKRAQAVYHAAGFQNEGILREAVFKDGEYKDLIVMSVIRREFKSND